MTNLVLALLETERPLSLREIGDAVAGYPAQHGALRQAFERDKRTLRDGGIPIATDRIEGDDQIGYRIAAEAYYLPDLGLSPEEESALAFALAAVRLDGGGSDDLAAKLGATGSPSLPPVALLPSAPALGRLEQAIRDRAYVTFGYGGRKRRVAGYGLVFKEGSWYLVGDDTTAAEAGALRTFRVDRIEDDPEPSEPGAYEPPEGFDPLVELRFAPFGPSRSGPDAVAPTEVVLEVEARSALGAVALAGEGAVEDRTPEGGVRLRFLVADEAAFCSYVLGLGEDAVVIEPPALRERVIEALREVSLGEATAPVQMAGR